MKPHDVTDGELSDYIITALAKQTGRGRGFWRRAIVGLVIRPESNNAADGVTDSAADGTAGGGANWTLRLNGAPDYAAQIDAVIASLQREFPVVVKQ